jgi:hypothetical protein
MRSRATLAAIAVVAALGLTAPLAHADKVTVTIDTDAAGQGRYAGKVKTNRDRCKKGRTVQVYDQVNGGFFIGETKTDDKGHFELFEFVPQPGQQVRVVVPEKKTGHGRCPGVSTIAAVPEAPSVP